MKNLITLTVVIILITGCNGEGTTNTSEVDELLCTEVYIDQLHTVRQCWENSDAGHIELIRDLMRENYELRNPSNEYTEVK